MHAVKVADYAAVATMVTDYATFADGRWSCCTPERGHQDASHGGKKVPRTSCCSYYLTDGSNTRQPLLICFASKLQSYVYIE
jgi:hypothetical protein